MPITEITDPLDAERDRRLRKKIRRLVAWVGIPEEKEPYYKRSPMTLPREPDRSRRASTVEKVA